MVKQKQIIRHITNVLLTTVAILTISIVMLICSIFDVLIPSM